MWRGHVVPLTPRVKAILTRLRVLAGGSPYLFPAGPQARVRATISQERARRRLGRAGLREEDVHGLPWPVQDGGQRVAGLWRNEVVEMQLAHARGSAVEVAYNDAEYLPERRKLMAWWSDRISTPCRRTPRCGSLR